MTDVFFPYGKQKLKHTFGPELKDVLTSGIEDYRPQYSQQELVERAVAAPVGSVCLSELAKGKNKVVIIASDHTRPVPSRLIMPVMLREIRKGNAQADITILIATGCHRGTTKDELVAKFGEEIVKNEKIHIHDCDDQVLLTDIGTLPSGGRCRINSLAANADLLVAEGFIEPHFFAGFSGGRKSVLPGVAARETVMYNHCSEFIAHPCARTGVLENNPIHRDMLWASKKAVLAFIVNVVLNGEKEVIYACAGEAEKAHRAGTEFLSSLCGVAAEPADIVITTNGGYPLDQNVYQAVKGMTAAEGCVRQGGVIIMLAASNDGIGGQHFYDQLAGEEDIDKTLALFMSRDKNETVPDQWQTQIMLRVLKRARVIYVSQMEDEAVKQMHMLPAHSIDQALDMAKKLLNSPDPTVIAIPDGVSVIVK